MNSGQNETKLAEPSGISPTLRESPPVAPPLRQPGHGASSAPTERRQLSAADVIVVPRNRIRWYYLMLVMTAIFFFCLGWLANYRLVKQSGTPGKTVEGGTPVLLSGQLRYGRPTGLPIPDAGGVVIVLPVGATPERPIPIEGLRPWDSNSAVGQINRQRLTELGGTWTQTAEDGSYSVVLPRPGQYWVLAISKNLARPKEVLELTRRGIAELDYEQLSRYFERPADLIGPQAYRWSLETIGPAGLQLNHDFQVHGELGIPELP